MFSDVVLIHGPAERVGQNSSLALTDDFSRLSNFDPSKLNEIFFWQTCLRQLVLIDETTLGGVRPVLARGDEIYHGDMAFQFLLQIICGLHSPLVGETEVYGQFKNAAAAYTAKTPMATPWDARVRRFFKALFQDAKRIRQAHLEDLGSQSYGSVLRRELKSHQNIHILGAGQLVQEILPWIAKDGKEIHVYARDPEKARGLLGFKENIFVHAIEDQGVQGLLASADALVIAAPVSSSKISEWLPKNANFSFIADLRADSSTDRFECAARLLDLAELFSRITTNQALLDERKTAALEAIAAAVGERNQHVEYRPFGWEDVCA
jgi:glutamyl-tRNA reductase